MKKNTRHYHYSQLFTITQGVTPPTGDTPEILQVSHKNLSVRQYVLYMECVRDQTWNIWNHCDAPLWVATEVSFFIYINAGKVNNSAVLELTHLTETPRVRVNTNNWFLHFLTSFGLSDHWPEMLLKLWEWRIRLLVGGQKKCAAQGRMKSPNVTPQHNHPTLRTI